ncbi:MAG: hypothetical protein US83_C0015G0023 [Candidatus Falkowbacteria bacterium GW2011_GWC2_38_22]|nr:MAG: hypothetical protein US73_C0013G0023 [Candidatus Falkowbacteria bacterium GW2011_GWF2_38_1205]KKQ60615.1 MAG: hypothetical protein US83_C0015G0023 [Candidatus Falkowbacteria bacterium GW2011_GWC2_38_22]KKQ62706.1 MAG: hypothetical protein US84_C0012G0023 [Candidatus Falkowbacteria bacterium GW2011_GWF1_38_22]KKQ64833.1 MAG: hypothetical protein US87_C0012G0023 [Candidatus Falkowbacteria bacterium GW2011_GWE2_38_254]KKQ72075.1 MAG: hypothetical protein US93_C0012G0023 [Candidatus Falkowb
MNKYKISDILHFEKYYFTDNNSFAKHFALVLLPSQIMNFQNNLLCSVITSKEEKYYSLKLESDKYCCFTKNSYACFKRRDIQNICDLSNNKQPVGQLDKNDFKKAFAIIKSVYYGSDDIYLMATVIREWKKIKSGF